MRRLFSIVVLVVVPILLLVGCDVAKKESLDTFVLPDVMSLDYPSSECFLQRDDVYGILELRCGEQLPRLDMSHLLEESYDASERNNIVTRRIMQHCKHGNSEYNVKCANPQQIVEGRTARGLPYVRFMLTSTTSRTDGTILAEETVGPLYGIELNRNEDDQVTLLLVLPLQPMNDGINPFYAVREEQLLHSIVQSIEQK